MMRLVFLQETVRTSPLLATMCEDVRKMTICKAI